ncbi:RHS repeat-associated core domain-containing protein [Microbulbifer sp. THAF38]|uniref:RHS repeat-associated core domain-containing protein n=1 Tax=Microbulbifer sp. THAF38 TaxID=2587856 RepID=UPI001267FA75|nr:RHS repeat-associated core domain-containing protein [Microbulbifer sp. THAF38]QFT55204.1 tRNA nuclease WapA precursor [Microbulbifer sp. THAF38]
MSGDSGSRTLDYTVFDKPSLVTKGSHDTRFTYGPDRSRYKRVDDNGKGTVTTLQIGSVEKVIERSASGAHIKSFYRRNIAGVAIERVELNASDEIASTNTQYLHKDLQGSLDVITDSTGQVAKDAAGNKLVYSFDAWGKRRNALSWEQIAGAPANTVSALSVGAFNHLSSNRGYTGHEMLDGVGLIHMNGRVYDPTLARFVSADPMIDGITSVQGYNRYAYVHNNPLTYTDPSGYSFWNKFRDAFFNGRDVMRYLGGKPVLNAVAQIALYISSGPGCPAALAAYNAAQTYHITGEIGLAFANGVHAGISAAAFSGMPGGWSPTNIAIRGVTGGILAKLGGGKFAHGFISAGVGGGFGKNTHIAVKMVVSGLVSEATGGKFINGAATAAFSHIAGSFGENAFGDDGPIKGGAEAGGKEGVTWSLQEGATSEDLAQAQKLWEAARCRVGEATGLIIDLETSKLETIILIGDIGNSAAPSLPSGAVNPDIGSSGTIRFNPWKKGFLTGGIERSPEASLIHEAYHVYEFQQGSISRTDTRKLAEISATAFENRHRKVMNLPQRTHYGEWEVPTY